MKPLYFLLMAILLLSCSDNEEPIPDCILDEITLEEEGGCADGMDEYIFNGQRVFIFTQSEPVCSDFGSYVFDESCNELCFIGGIAGFTLCQDINFIQNAEYQRTIWTK